MNEVRKGFGLEGLQGLEGRIIHDIEDSLQQGETVVARPQMKYQQAALDLVLPAFMVRDGDHWKLAHYEEDILFQVSWTDVDIDPLFKLV